MSAEGGGGGFDSMTVDGGPPPAYGGGHASAPAAATAGGHAAPVPKGAPAPPQQKYSIPGAEDGALPDDATTQEGKVYVHVAAEWSELRPNQLAAFDEACKKITAQAGSFQASGYDGSQFSYAVEWDGYLNKYTIQLRDGYFHAVLDRRGP